MTDTPVRGDVAMTGEVTLTGKGAPDRRLKRESLAALRHGVKDVLIPFLNIKDLADIPDDFRNRLNFIPVNTWTEVLAVAFEKGGAKKRANTAGGSGQPGRDGRKPRSRHLLHDYGTIGLS